MCSTMVWANVPLLDAYPLHGNIGSYILNYVHVWLFFFGLR